MIMNWLLRRVSDQRSDWSHLLRQKSPVNGQYGASNEGRFVRCEEQDRICHLTRLAQPSHRMCSFHRL
jgi:hypothetical protein